ncbi:hypothetical protein I548_5460 [Mycobacterium intracellulare]|nr:hypothetical protein I548_5460 [Mycobacterium intracellulare]
MRWPLGDSEGMTSGLAPNTTDSNMQCYRESGRFRDRTSRLPLVA